MSNDRDSFMERFGPKLMVALAYLAAGAILFPVGLALAAPFLL